MSIVLEELPVRPFLRLCQFVGLIPYRIEFHPKTNRFQRFSFSFKYPITWWYTLLFLSVICAIYINWVTSPSVKMVSEDNPTNIMSGSSSMALKTAIGVISIFTYGVLNVIGIGARFVYLRCSTIKKMWDYMQQFEDGLKMVKIEFQISLGRRIIIGLILSMCSVIIISYRTWIKNLIDFIRHFLYIGDHLHNNKVGDGWKNLYRFWLDGDDILDNRSNFNGHGNHLLFSTLLLKLLRSIGLHSATEKLCCRSQSPF